MGVGMVVTTHFEQLVQCEPPVKETSAQLPPDLEARQWVSSKGGNASALSPAFLHLLRRMSDWQASKRASAAEALQIARELPAHTNPRLPKGVAGDENLQNCVPQKFNKPGEGPRSPLAVLQ